MADDASAAGLEVLPLSDAAQQTLRSWVPFAAPRNPVDITGQVTNDFTLMERSARLMLEDQHFASWIGFFAAGGSSDTAWPVLHALVTNLRAAHPDTVLAISTLVSPARRAEIEALGCLVFADPSVGIRTIAALARRAERPASTPADATATSAVVPGPVHLPAGTLSEPHSLALLVEAGVPVIEHRLVHTAEEAALALPALGGEIALKIASADIPHKSDIGGVVLGLRNAEQVHAAFERMQASVRTAQPHARVDGVLAARMVRGGVECIAGVHRDPVFGPILMFGLGGVHVEILRDVSLRALPVTRSDVHAMVRELKALPLLQGARGKPAADIESVVDSLLALAAFATTAGDTLESAEINPLIARTAAEGGCVAVDALVIGRAAAMDRNTPRYQPHPPTLIATSC